MSNFEMNIYVASTGVQMTITWDNEEQYRLGKKLLTDMGAIVVPANGETREFFGLDNKQQLASLLKFMQSLKDKKNPPSN